MRIRDFTVIVAGICLFVLPGCFDFDWPETPDNRSLRCRQDVCEVRERMFIDPAGTRFQYVIDDVRLPSNPAEAVTNALDVDCSEPERKDNTLGQVLATISSQLEVDIQGVTEELVSTGQIIHLLEVQTLDPLSSTNVGVQMFIGTDSDSDPSDNFSGSEEFVIDDGFPSEPMAGQMISGSIEADLGTVPLQVIIPGSDEVFTLQLRATLLEGSFTPERITATLAGVISREEIESGFLTATHVGIASIVAADCDSAGCVIGSRGELLVGYFDTDEDSAISLQEFLDNDLVQALTAPDVDVFDESGAINPGCDDLPDSLSAGVVITGVPAQF